MSSSTAIPSAKPPLKHIPTAPTPGPPARSCRSRASARSHSITGDVWLSFHVVNSRETHTCPNDFATYGADIGLPGSPTNDGIATVNPSATRRRPKSATNGVIPGTSCTTTTPGPEPPRYTSRVVPAWVKESSVNPSSAAAMAAHTTRLRALTEPA